MNELLHNQEKMTSIASKELRALRAEIKHLQKTRDQEKSKNSMLLYLMGWGRDRIDEKDKWLIILQEKVNSAIVMLDDVADHMDIVKVLKEDVDFYERHPTFVSGMNEGKVISRSSEEAVDEKRPDQ